MKEEIYKFIEQCEISQKEKLSRIKNRPPVIITDTPFDPFEKISIDTVGPLDITPDGHVHILTIQDNFSKFCCAIPLPDIRTQTIAEALVNHFICLYRCPKVISSDRGTSFTSKLLNKLAKTLKIDGVTTSAYHPQSNGALKGSHHSLVEYLRAFITPFNDWDKYLLMAMFSYNSSVHSSTKLTPYELLYGKLARASTSFPDFSEINTYPEALEKLILRLAETRSITRENLLKAKNKSKERFDEEVHEEKFTIGDFVRVQNEPRRNKLDPHYTGPYEIVDITEQGNYILKKQDSTRFMKHLSKIKKFSPPIK